MNAADSEIFISLRLCSMEEEECQLIHPAARSAGHTFQRGLLRFQPLSTLQKGGKCCHWACAGFSETCGEAFTEHSPNHNTDRSFQVLPSTFYTYVWEPAGNHSGFCPWSCFSIILSCPLHKPSMREEPEGSHFMTEKHKKY